MPSFVWILLAYLSGSIPSGLLLTRWKTRQDVRSHGSGNIGATNVARVAGKKLGAVVLLLDVLKGALPVLAVKHALPGQPDLHAITALAAFLGHVFPIWLKLKGGKGVATGLGVLVVLQPWAALAGIVTYALVFAVWRVSSVGSLVGGLTAVTLGFVFDVPRAYALLGPVLILMMLWTHRENLKRLRARTEKPIV